MSAAAPVSKVRFRLRELLARAGISQGELSRRSGVSMSTVSRMATNKTAQVSLDTLARLSEVLGCEPGELVGRAGRKRR